MLLFRETQRVYTPILTRVALFERSHRGKELNRTTCCKSVELRDMQQCISNYLFLCYNVIPLLFFSYR